MTAPNVDPLQLFLASLGGLPPEEMLKAKELYLRNAIAEYAEQKKQFKNFWTASLLHLLIPIFWPMLFSARRSQKADMELSRAKILNALRVWKTELGPLAKTLESELDALETV